MAVKYLLPCPCGRRVRVEPRQAGETILCTCGASLQAPTLSKILSLEPAPPEAPSTPTAHAWNAKHQLKLLGSVLILIALAGGTWLHLARPVSRFDIVDPEQISQSAKKLSPLQAWNIWETMKQGLDRRTDQQYEAAVASFHVKEAFVAVLALLGLALIVAGAVGSKGLGIRD